MYHFYFRNVYYNRHFYAFLSIIIDVMNKKSHIILPSTSNILETMGEQIKMARLRRNLSMNLVCQRAGISRATLYKVEKGDPSVAIGIYASTLHALNNMDSDLLLIAKDDKLGRTIQDLNIRTRRRASKARCDK